MQDAYVYLTISTGAEVREIAREYNKFLYELQRVARRADTDEWPKVERQTHDQRRKLREAMRIELGVQD